VRFVVKIAFYKILYFGLTFSFNKTLAKKYDFPWKNKNDYMPSEWFGFDSGWKYLEQKYQFQRPEFFPTELWGAVDISGVQHVDNVVSMPEPVRVFGIRDLLENNHCPTGTYRSGDMNFSRQLIEVIQGTGFKDYLLIPIRTQLFSRWNEAAEFYPIDPATGFMKMFSRDFSKLQEEVDFTDRYFEFNLTSGRQNILDPDTNLVNCNSDNLPAIFTITKAGGTFISIELFEKIKHLNIPSMHLYPVYQGDNELYLQHPHGQRPWQDTPPQSFTPRSL
jgi:hypothetical protein